MSEPWAWAVGMVFLGGALAAAGFQGGRWIGRAEGFAAAWRAAAGEAARAKTRGDHAGLADGRRIERERRELATATIDVWRRDDAARRN